MTSQPAVPTGHRRSPVKLSTSAGSAARTQHELRGGQPLFPLCEMKMN